MSFVRPQSRMKQSDLFIEAASRGTYFNQIKTMFVSVSWHSGSISSCQFDSQEFDGQTWSSLVEGDEQQYRSKW